ncbi:lipopolysaccharide heptosyltransferase I [Bacterioplanes sanyensis]|uniref:lipopolysaccharide heptosyltransferase I n=1 Tax=Bacterioplanes sanyensis TaxID=1249553 RepID=UPI001677D038|nr:lipopolysaccharide heptosyltransferase I [Bacterioplanes sanyensis]
MKVLIVKTSSLGDVFHTLPAIEDAYRQRPDIEFHWLVEEAFADIPAWHPAVTKVIPVGWRRWRKQLWRKEHRQQLAAFVRELRAEQYDAVIDAQGLIKSALFTRLARGPRYGLDKHSCREPLAAQAYQHPQAVAKGQHAIPRVRQLLSQVLDYALPPKLSYGIDRKRWQRPDIPGAYWLFLHGTTWETKLWPEAYWCELADKVTACGASVVLPWGNDEEFARAQRIASGRDKVQVLPKMGLNELNAYLAHATAVVGVDTGLSHVVAALEVPAVAIYGATDADLTGVLGPQVTVMRSQRHCAPCLSKQCLQADDDAIQPPCYRDVPPQRVFEHLQAQLTGGL